LNKTFAVAGEAVVARIIDDPIFRNLRLDVPAFKDIIYSYSILFSRVSSPIIPKIEVYRQTEYNQPQSDNRFYRICH